MGKGILESRDVNVPNKLIGISCKTFAGTKIVNRQRQDLGELHDLMLDFHANRILYGVLTYSGFAGVGRKMFAIPWEAFTIENESSFTRGTERFLTVNIPQEALKEANCFDENDWPNQPDYEWLKAVYAKYGYRPYWEEQENRTPV